MKPLKLATYLLILNSFLLLLYSYSIYYAFAIFSFVLAIGVMKRIRLAIKLALIYAGIELFFSLLFLMAGNIASAVDATISLLILHDIISYVQEKG
ncbi:hypothetical protein PFDSM3638_09235 [Pyrococcus furiosus DSM 3638]|uniref:Uncharacterized protein n=3 Tax=Pyrococcus furiosus TaxID=2261 RepID=Q8TZY9_PYRFU|nr:MULTISPECIES: hypothetical protein [Pyrococcus]AAL81960.1 hypothetical protein PF1836 [Pyrococcus furiosus DSM 3638]AFN04805.1 hypothetical protein PFC_09410 [Pyrococcus furiosus COM1]MDK2869550.1 hypothetical protein [Pyrococcus sp.]QEK79438.1 hypothetical protein PFDSM3638_09235 [Pyrococcus furiosus DSM 3638]